MDAQQFLAEFGHIANAPGGVARLQELILHLAVSGDLVQVDSPVVAGPLLELIKIQKHEHPEQKKMVAKQAPVSRVAIKAPSHWAVCRLGDLTLTITGGGTPSKNVPAYWGSGNIPWASVKDLKNLKFLDDTEDHITEEGLKNSSSNLIPPNRVIVCTRMGLGKVAINRVAMAINQDLKALELPPEVNPDFFLILYKTREVKGKGMTVAGIKQDQLLSLPAVLPPLGEQSLIAAKVDELMGLCNQLETQQQACRIVQTAVRQSTLQAVANAQSPQELKTTWTLLEANFEGLFAASEDVIDLAQCAKQLALKGLLTSKMPGEAVSARILQLATSSAAVEASEADWLIPEHWVWARCAWLGEARLGKMLDVSKNQGEFRPYLRNVNVRWHRFDLADVLQMRIEDHELPRVTIKRGDLVICEGGEPGRAAIWDSDKEFVIQKALHRFRCGQDVVQEYLLFCLEHDFFSGRLARYYTGATIKHLTGKALAEYPIPLPPVNEQLRILDAAKALSTRFANLKDMLKERNQLAELLAIATIATFTGIAIEQEEDKPVKAPQTELIAPLRLGQSPDVKAQAPLATLLGRHNDEMSATDLWQRFGGEIDVFYAQLKTEVAHGWIQEPVVAEVREKEVDTAGV